MIGAVIVTLLPFAGEPARADPPPPATSVVGETFDGSSVSDPSWTVQGVTCLTGALGAPAPGVAQIPDCSARRTGPVPTVGATPGYLQLTDASPNSVGSILYNQPIPAAAGVSFTFFQYQYGGTGADGIGFFLVDGSTDLAAPGAPGGGLGYTQGPGSQFGVEGGYVGVGLDAWGNFSNDGGKASGCAADERSPITAPAPNVIAVRGPGDKNNGYCYLESTTPKPITNPNRPGTTLRGTLRSSSLAASERQVNIQVTPDLPGSPARIIVEVRYTLGGPWIRELDIAAPPGIPATYKFGLSASTGRVTDVHLVRGVSVATINPLGELQLAKQIDRSAPALPAVITPGTVVPYVFTVTNSGLANIDNLTIDDPQVTGVTCDRTTLTIAPAVGSTAVCRGTHVLTAGDASPLTNTAVARATPAGTAIEVTSNVATVTVPLVSAMSLVKSVVTPPPYTVGQHVTYGYALTNTGESAIVGIVVSDDRIPKQASIVCPRSTLVAGASMLCTGDYVVTAAHVAANGTLTNTAVAVGETSIGQRVASASSSQTINVFTDVAVTKSVDNTAPLVGSTVTFVVTAANRGPSIAQDVVVSDLLPARLTLVSATPSTGSYTATTGAWAIPSLAVGASATLTMRAIVHTNGVVVNAATRTAMKQTDINHANDTASVVLNPIEPTLDLALTESIDVTDIPLGGRAVFSVRVDNHGPFAGTGITVRTQIPAGLAYQPTDSGGDGTFDPATGVWTIGSLPVGGSATFDFAVTGARIGSYVNLAAITAVAPRDTDPDDNVGSSTLQVRAPQADLSIAKHVAPAEGAVVGDEVTYSIEVANNGPEPVTGVFVTDVSPPGLPLSSITLPNLSQGTFDSSQLRWDVGGLGVDEVAQAIITFRLDEPGTMVNTVIVNAPSVADPEPGNNQATASLLADPTPVDIAITKSGATLSGAPLDAVPLGDTIVFDITATNTSTTNTATNVLVTEVTDTAFAVLTATADIGTVIVASGQWTIPTLPPGTIAHLRVEARAIQPGQHANTVTLSHLNEADTDPRNNSASVSLDVVNEADLEISMSNSTSVAQPGDLVDYTITITNHGPNDANDITAFDPDVIDALIVATDIPADTTFDQARRLWSIPSLANGASVTLTVTIQIRPGRSGQFDNTVVVSSSGVPDHDLTNDIAFARLFVPSADVTVSLQADRTQVLVGDTVTLTVGVSNQGPDDAVDVSVTDLVPSGLTLVSATPSTGSYDATAGVWTVGSLAPVDLAVTAAAATTATTAAADAAPQAQLTLIAQVDTVGVFTNTATSPRTPGFPFDPEQTNNTAAITLTATDPADVAIQHTIGPAGVTIGQTAVLTFDVTNNGPGDADSITIHDTLPTAFVPGTLDPRCSIVGQDLTCIIATLAVGERTSITLTVTAGAVGQFDNVVSVTASNPDPSPDNNTAAATLTIATPTVAPPRPAVPPPPTAPIIATPPGTLPATGSSPAVSLLLAAASISAGCAVVLIARRRRLLER